MGSKLVLGMLLWSFAAFAGEIEVTVVENGSERWTEPELKLIKDAAKIAFNRLAASRSVTCALRNSFRPRILNSKGKSADISKDQLRLMWEKQSGVINKGRKVTIEVNKSELGAKVLGLAEIGIAHTNREQYTMSNIKISLDQVKIAEELTRNGKAAALDVWVNTIAHETAHTFSHLHGADPNSDWEGNYAGYFPTELGFCVMSDGAYGSDLGKPEKFRARKERFKFK